jgi:hypothetical protein
MGKRPTPHLNDPGGGRKMGEMGKMGALGPHLDHPLGGREMVEMVQMVEMVEMGKMGARRSVGHRRKSIDSYSSFGLSGSAEQAGQVLAPGGSLPSQ